MGGRGPATKTSLLSSKPRFPPQTPFRAGEGPETWPQDSERAAKVREGPQKSGKGRKKSGMGSGRGAPKPGPGTAPRPPKIRRRPSKPGPRSRARFPVARSCGDRRRRLPGPRCRACHGVGTVCRGHGMSWEWPIWAQMYHDVLLYITAAGCCAVSRRIRADAARRHGRNRSDLFPTKPQTFPRLLGIRRALVLGADAGAASRRSRPATRARRGRRRGAGARAAERPTRRCL